jgi:hypothetical protein
MFAVCYIKQVHTMWLSITSMGGAGTMNKKVLRHVLGMGICMLLIDLTWIVQGYSVIRELQFQIECVLFSIKILIEFRCLSQLTELSGASRTRMQDFGLIDKNVAEEDAMKSTLPSIG